MLTNDEIGVWLKSPPLFLVYTKRRQRLESCVFREIQIQQGNISLVECFHVYIFDSSKELKEFEEKILNTYRGYLRRHGYVFNQDIKKEMDVDDIQTTRYAFITNIKYDESTRFIHLLIFNNKENIMTIVQDMIRDDDED